MRGSAPEDLIHREGALDLTLSSAPTSARHVTVERMVAMGDSVGDRVVPVVSRALGSLRARLGRSGGG